MMIDRYVLAAAALIAIVLLSYVLNFYFRLDFVVSNEPEAWGQLGDYIGGILNPMLSFISIVLLIKSLSLQNEANLALRDEIITTKKTERLRSFEAQLFNMLNSQRIYFDSFKIADGSGEFKSYLVGAEAVIKIEDVVEGMRANSSDSVVVTAYLDLIDSTDQLYGLTRVFYNMVKVVDDKLSDSNGFTEDDRRSHYLTIINFTDFALLRLIMMSAQFMSYPPTDYLRSNAAFNSVLNDVELSYNLY